MLHDDHASLQGLAPTLLLAFWQREGLSSDMGSVRDSHAPRRQAIRAAGLLGPCYSDAGLHAVPPLADEQEELEEDEDLKQQQVLEGLPWGFTITSKARQEWTHMDPPNRSASTKPGSFMPCARHPRVCQDTDVVNV